MKSDPTLLIRPNTYGPLMAVLTGFHCIQNLGSEKCFFVRAACHNLSLRNELWCKIPGSFCSFLEFFYGLGFVPTKQKEIAIGRKVLLLVEPFSPCCSYPVWTGLNGYLRFICLQRR